MSNLKADFQLTRKELEILKEALDSHLDGFSPDDNAQAWDEASMLRDFIIFKLEESKESEILEQSIAIAKANEPKDDDIPF